LTPKLRKTFRWGQHRNGVTGHLRQALELSPAVDSLEHPRSAPA
jgi:hypothetical protein